MIPNYIYKFYAFNEYSLDVFSTNTVWFSTQDSLNDPFEAISKIIEPESRNDRIVKAIDYTAKVFSKVENIPYSEAKNLAMSIYFKDPDQFLQESFDSAMLQYEQAREFVKTFGIYSTSSDIPNDDRSNVSNMIMWSLYADGFRGFCLKFKARSFYESLLALNPHVNFSHTLVHYTNKPNEIDLYEIIDESTFSHLESLQFKHEQWINECECRILSTGTGKMKYHPDCLDSVFLGGKVSDEHQESILKISKSMYPNSKVHKVTIDEQSYSIKISKNLCE